MRLFHTLVKRGDVRDALAVLAVLTVGAAAPAPQNTASGTEGRTLLFDELVRDVGVVVITSPLADANALRFSSATDVAVADQAISAPANMSLRAC